MDDKAYFEQCTAKIIATRADLTKGLLALGYTVIPSSANFVLAKSPEIGGAELYALLKKAGILVRHFDDARIADYIRITVGTDEQTAALLKAVGEMEEKYA